jgi:hypothetical protein
MLLPTFRDIPVCIAFAQRIAESSRVLGGASIDVEIVPKREVFGVGQDAGLGLGTEGNVQVIQALTLLISCGYLAAQQATPVQ